ncbi:MAG: rhomboid family intramembrane serine protease [Lachnospiraceae bacterium]|nr:rhomboid family intramembrane serine protease [Lachnospiraceae bacterium]
MTKTESPVTVVIVLLNAVIFFVTLTAGEALVSIGVMDYDLVLGGQFYRFVTAMFLHGSIDHLVGNMLLLFAMGEMVEKVCGSVKYAVIYFSAGILGNAASLFYEMISGARYSSLGASGAVYGILGALIVLALKRVSGINIVRQRIPLALIYCLYSSFIMPNIDFAAHIGGFIAGVILTSLLVRGDNTDEETGSGIYIYR